MTNSFDTFVNDLMHGDADLVQMRANTKGGPVVDKSQQVKRNAKVATVAPKPVVTARQKLLTKMHAFNEQHPGLGTFLKESASWSEFAASLYNSLLTKGSLSEKQVDAANRMRAKSTTATVDLTPIREMFELAVGNGYKKPVYRAEGLVINRAPDTGANPGALYVKADAEYQGKILGTTFTGVRNLLDDTMDALAIIAKDPEQAAIAYGRRTGKCACCGRKLTVHASIERGIGPVCAEKWGF